MIDKEKQYIILWEELRPDLVVGSYNNLRMFSIRKHDDCFDLNFNFPSTSDFHNRETIKECKLKAVKSLREFIEKLII